MAVTITAGFSRKVGEPNYGSRGASLHLEVELDRGMLEDPEHFRAEVEGIFERAREAVDRELHRGAPTRLEPCEASDGSSDRGSESGRPRRLATPNQIRAIQRIAQNRMVVLSQLLDTRFGERTLDELSIVEASLLIEQLQSLRTNGEEDRSAVR
jgi:hypothetical protein